MPNATSDPPARARRLFSLAGSTAVALLLVVLAIEIWALASTDPDYYLPDPFRPLVIALVALFLATAFIRARRARRVRQALRFLALVLAVVLLLLEGRTRFAESRPDPWVQRSADPLLRYGFKPGAERREYLPGRVPFKVSSLGFADLERAIPKPPDVYRVVVVTGSVANDEQVPFDERFWRRLEGLLGEQDLRGRRVEVANVSCDGYSTVQQIRALETVGVRLQPDLVVLAYMLSNASLQDGAYRRFGNSFFMFRFLPPLKKWSTGSMCSLFQPFHESYSYGLVVRNSMERLALLRRVHGFEVLVAVLPIVEDAGDPLCARLYDQVTATAREAGLEAVRVADWFDGMSAKDMAKPRGAFDVCHPNAEGHRRFAVAIAEGVKRIGAGRAPAIVAPGGAAP